MSHNLQDQVAALRHNLEVAAVQGRVAIQIESHAVEWIADQLERQSKFFAWLKEREQWLTNEISGGGNWEHLNTRRGECSYIRVRFSSLFSSDQTSTQEQRS